MSEWRRNFTVVIEMIVAVVFSSLFILIFLQENSKNYCSELTRGRPSTKYVQLMHAPVDAVEVPGKANSLM